MTLTPSTRTSLLLRLCDAQDHEAWVQFVALYEPVVYRLLRQHGLQDVDARDVMQELFLAVSRSIERWDPQRESRSFRGWLRRVVRNLVIDFLRNRQRRVLVGGADLQRLLDQLPAADDPKTIEFDREVRRAQFQYASKLVQKEIHSSTWQAFWETSVVGLSPGTVAEKLGISVGAVRVAKSRVIARLKAVVADMEISK